MINRVFQGIMNLNELEVGDQEGYDPEVLLFIKFHTRMIGG